VQSGSEERRERGRERRRERERERVTDLREEVSGRHDSQRPRAAQCSQSTIRLLLAAHCRRPVGQLSSYRADHGRVCRVVASPHPLSPSAGRLWRRVLHRLAAGGGRRHTLCSPVTASARWLSWWRWHPHCGSTQQAAEWWPRTFAPTPPLCCSQWTSSCPSCSNQERLACCLTCKALAGRTAAASSTPRCRAWSRR
jgi:hypothetical protein